MANPTYDVMTSIFSKMLPAFKAFLAKAEADAAARKIDPQVFLDGRLAPDMLPLVKQVQIATDQVKGGMGRLAGVAVPSWDDNERTFADLQARLDKAIAYVQQFKAAQYEGAETRAIELKYPTITFNFTGKDYLYGFVVPNFYFHMTTAYAILRHFGVPIGKRDFLGG